MVSDLGLGRHRLQEKNENLNWVSWDRGYGLAT